MDRAPKCLVRELGGWIVHPRWTGLSFRLLNLMRFDDNIYDVYYILLYTVMFRLIFQLSIHLFVFKSVCLSLLRLFPSSNGEGGRQLYKFIEDYSLNQQFVHLSIFSSRGRSRYIDISTIYILSKLRY